MSTQKRSICLGDNINGLTYWTANSEQIHFNEIILDNKKITCTHHEHQTARKNPKIKSEKYHTTQDSQKKSWKSTKWEIKYSDKWWYKILYYALSLSLSTPRYNRSLFLAAPSLFPVFARVCVLVCKDNECAKFNRQLIVHYDHKIYFKLKICCKNFWIDCSKFLFQISMFGELLYTFKIY